MCPSRVHGHLLLTKSCRASSKCKSLLEDEYAAVPKRFETADVTPVETAFESMSIVFLRYLQFRCDSRPQSRAGFEQRRAAVDVDQQH